MRCGLVLAVASMMAPWSVGQADEPAATGPEASSDDVVKIITPSTGRDNTAVEFRFESARHCVRFRDLDAKSSVWRDTFPVRIVGLADQAVPPMLGTYRLSESVVSFVPRYPWVAGQRYMAEVWLGDSRPQPGASKSFVAVPQPERRPRIVGVFPSGAEIPENQLKFYIEFSGPMGRGESYRHIELRDAAGQPIPDPFLELGEELWNPTGTRMTVLIDPGRIKRGLKPREDVGPVLQAGHGYELVIRPTWCDADGVALSAGRTQRYRVATADTEQPDVANWTLDLPRAGTHEALVVRFHESLDRAMLEHSLVVVMGGAEVTGAIGVTTHESVWTFVPRRPWREASYELVARSTLEDLAGNSLERPFEVEMSSSDRRAKAPKRFARQFDVVP